MDAFDADALIYATVPGHALGRRVVALLPGATGPDHGAGGDRIDASDLRAPDQEDADEELVAPAAILPRLELRPVDPATAELVVARCVVSPEGG